MAIEIFFFQVLIFRNLQATNIILKIDMRTVVGAIILAAGESTRMGKPKALLRLEGRTFLDRVISIYRRSVEKICLILGKDSESIRAETDLTGVTTAVNSQPENGPLSSIHIGLDMLQEASGVIIHPVDHPLVSSLTIFSLVQSHSAHPDSILIPRFQGKNGHPVMFPRTYFSELKAAAMNVGARWVVRNHPSQVLYIDVADPGILANINTQEEYRSVIEKRRPLRARH
jgi:molybdenum cofactor cytidylyltransferase